VEITVAVFARPNSPTLRMCLEALRAEGAEPTVYPVSGRHGLAAARNEALAATSHDVLAFADDDVVICQGWRAALQAAWENAPDDRGCVGGPIGVRFLGPRPPWFTDAMLGVFGVAPGGTTFHGGNVSFRVDALRGVQGFWPARGRAELHDWFSEEHHAQRELAAVGWTAACASRAVAERIVDPAITGRRAVLARRLRYGARSASIGERRPRTLAARVAARSAAGVPLALVSRDEARAMERAARAAENAGALLAPLVAHRDLQPAARRTPFRHSVPAPKPLLAKPFGRLRRCRPLVLLYHRVDDGAGAGVSPANFASQLEVVCNERMPARLDEIVRGEAPADAVALTFDDGYAETMRRVYPLLAEKGLHATVFVCTSHVRSQRPFWWDRVGAILRAATRRKLTLTIEGETRAWADARAAEPHLVAWLQPKTPEVIDKALADLRAWAHDHDHVPVDERPLSMDELKALAASPLISVDSHTRTHPNLGHVDQARRMDELVGSRQHLAQWLGIDPPLGLAYPFGVPGADVDRATRAAARTAGFEYAMLSVAGTVTAATDRLALPRLAPGNVDARAFAALIGRAARRWRD
jgi:peptidoglycan/xylan/chitin deacetylase (PgdA/CDA1 family)